MSEWVKLSDIGDWLNSRYGPYRRAGNGWGDSSLPDTLALALQGGSIRARGFSLHAAGRQVLTFSPACPVAIVALSGDVSVAGVAWWGVEVETAALEAYCDLVLGAVKELCPERPEATAPEGVLAGTELTDWISNCPTENYKTAYKMLRDQFGKRAPNRDDVFLPAWRNVKGYRGRGRIKKSPN